MMGRCRGRIGKARCSCDAASARAKFCRQCYLKRASASGQKSKGNAAGNPGNKGSAAGNPGNKGNAVGNADNKGNRKVGRQKKSAGKRSWLKRRAGDLLIIKDPW